MGRGVFVHLWVSNCGDNYSRRESYYGGVNNRTPLYNYLYLIATYIAPCVLWGGTLYYTIFTVPVTEYNIIPTAIPYILMHTAAVLYNNTHVTPMSIGRGYVGKRKWTT